MTLYQLESVRTVESNRLIVARRTYQPSFMFRLFGAKTTTEIVKFLGSGTVWHELPGFTNPEREVRGILKRFDLKNRHQKLFS